MTMRMLWLFESPEFCVAAGALLSLAVAGLHLVAALSLGFMANLFILDISGNR